MNQYQRAVETAKRHRKFAERKLAQAEHEMKIASRALHLAEERLLRHRKSEVRK